MSGADVWLAIAGISFSTLLTRAAFLVIDTDVRLPRAVEAALRYAPVCALTGIIAPELLVYDGRIELNLENIRLLAAGAAVGIYLITHSVLGTIAGGMGVFWLLRAFIGDAG
jgi:branched-subunit amino acid transport protein